MKLLILAVLIVLVNTNPEVTLVKNWKQILLNPLENCALAIDNNNCVRHSPYNTTKKAGKVNESEKATVTEKSIENFDEWTKKRRDQVAHQNGQQQKTTEPSPRHDEIVVNIPPIPRPTRNFASRECGAKIIAANPEAENAKAVVNEKDVDDYMRNPCQSAKEKFIVIELCEAIQVKKIAIGSFELFASRPKSIHVFISERYPPLGSWISLGSFQLQDHHKNLQTFEVPESNVYAKFVRINLEDHYGKEHYCIVSVVNVMGSTLADEYDNEEVAAQLMNALDKKEEEAEKEPTTPPPSEQKMQTQLPMPPRAPKALVVGEKLNYKQLSAVCNQCSIQRVSYHFCFILPDGVKKKKTVPTSTIRPAVSENLTLKKELGLWAERSRHLNFEHSRRRNLANIQRFKEKTVTNKPTATSAPTPTPKLDQFEKNSNSPEKKEEKPPKKPKSEPILPAGGSTSQREMVLMKLSKRISAVETNLTLSTEYLSELSKQYVNQMSGYHQELKETRKSSRQSAHAVEAVVRAKMNSVKRELRELRQSVHLLQQLEARRQSQNEMSRNLFMSSCHISSNVPPTPTLPQLPLILPSIGRMENFTNLEEKIKKIYQTAKSVMFGSLTWNTDHLIVALISFNVVALAFLFAGVFYIHRRNKERCEETQDAVKAELRARIAKVSFDNRKLIVKGMRKAELAVTAAVSSALKVEKSTSNRKAMSELETALANLFAAQQTRIEEQFTQNQRLLKDALSEGRRSRDADDTLSVEDSESSSETEHSKEDTPTF